MEAQDIFKSDCKHTNPVHSNGTIAFFDFDGTLSHTDTYTPFLFYSSSKLRTMVAGLLCLPTIGLYKSGLLSPALTRPILSFFTFVGRREKTLDYIGKTYFERELQHKLNPTVMDRMRWHKSQGDRVVVVSASLDVYLKHWCRHHDVEVMCSELVKKRGWYTGLYKRGDCHGERKSQWIEQTYNLSRYQSIYAYGNTSEDFAMLSLADNAFFVEKDGDEPKPWKVKLDTLES